jgi:hypothetical protein
LLQPSQLRKRSAGKSQALQEAGDEDRVERGDVVLQTGDCAAKRVGAGLAGGDQARRHLVGPLHLLEALYRPQCHSADAFNQPEAQHGRNGPEFADAQRGNFLERPDYEVDVVDVDAPLGMRNQRDGEIVNPRIPRQCSGR